jgi:hypothetical protein
MPNGDIDNVWAYLREMQESVSELRAEVRGISATLDSMQARQSQIPTFVWLAVTVAMTTGIWLADRIFSSGP